MEKPNRTERIKLIEELLLENNKGWTRAELARRFEVDRSTLKRDIDYILQKNYLPLRLEGDKIFLQSDAYLSNIKMDVNEMLALHLATRLLVKKSSFASRHYASLLRKISQSFGNHSQLISRYISDTADGLDELEKTKESHRRTKRLEDMNEAWTRQKKVRIQYKSKDVSKTYIMGIYCFEPYSEGFALHVVGLCEGESRLRDFKFERIESVRILDEDYDIPDDFCPHEYFRDAWGIWVTGEEPVTVKLRFDKAVAARVKENRWHVSEEVEELEDGSLIWTGLIAEPKEMVPWVRSWGDQVVVLEPEGLG
ncbi:MAG: WYL domain-containing transcriptional regulator [Spirochaetales bacterium]|nr:WYL domain-containing transcriptional regulator [Spirochaetales bacterium]